MVYDVELSEFIARKVNIMKLQNQTAALSKEEIIRIYNLLIENNITDESIRNKHIEALNLKEDIKDVDIEDISCAECGKKVTAKAADFCINNKKRLGGHIYCYDHQKMYV